MNWTHYALGARFRVYPDGGEERLAFDRRRGRPVTLRVYPRVSTVPFVPPVLRAQNLAVPLEVMVESGETIVARELAFGPSFADLMAIGPQTEAVVASLLRQVLEGLAALHAQGFWHLRLSPESIRFDLQAGVLKITDLELAAHEGAVSPALVPRWVEPDVFPGHATAANDVYSVGRLGEALLRGGVPLGAWGAPPLEHGAVWNLVQRWQLPVPLREEVFESRPADVAAALAQLTALPQRTATALTVPLAGFVGRQVRALRELRRWQTHPPSPLVDPSGGESPGVSSPQLQTGLYRELLSSAAATRLWGSVGLLGVGAFAATLLVFGLPSRGAEVRSTFTDEACVPPARAELLAPEARPRGELAALRVTLPEQAAVAIDGCPLAASGSPGPGTYLRVAVARGPHDLRAEMGAAVGTAGVEATGRGDSEAEIALAQVPAGAREAALEALQQQFDALPVPTPPAGQPFDPLAQGLLDVRARRLAAADAALFAEKPAARAALPVGVALAFDGLRAADRRFARQAVPCAAKIATAVAQNLRPANSGDSSAGAQQAAEFLTVTRLAGPHLHNPLRLEREGLSALHQNASASVLTAVDAASRDVAVGECLAGLQTAADEVEALSGLVFRELPALLGPDAAQDEPAAE